MKRLPIVMALVTLALLGGFTGRAQEGTRKFVPVTDAMLQKPDPANWLMWRRTLDGWGYSPLNQITRTNVGQLRMVWTRGLGQGNMEATPLVYDGVMYLPNPGDLIQAIDAVTGDLIWEYQRKLAEGARRSTKRNIAIYGNSIISTSSRQSRVRARHTDRQLCNGRRRSSTRVCRPTRAPDQSLPTARSSRDGSVSPAPRTKGASSPPTMPKPVRSSGEREPFPDLASPATRHGATCPWSSAGTSGRGWFRATIPELNLIYIGTSVTIPAPKFILGGNNNKHLYHNSHARPERGHGQDRLVLPARRGSLGPRPPLRTPPRRYGCRAQSLARWPGSIPKIKPGERRKVITGIPGKTGVVYTLDRQTGEFLWARPTVMQNVIKGIDGSDGRCDRERRHALYTDQSGALRLSRQQWREELAGGRLQPADQHDVLAAAEHVP